MYILHIVAIGCMVLWMKLFCYAVYDIMSTVCPTRTTVENTKLVNWTVHDYGTGDGADKPTTWLDDEYCDTGV